MDRTECIKLLKERLQGTLGLIDVGARWGIGFRWNDVADSARILCFDPDPDECAKLNSSSPSNIRYLPFGLAETDGDYTLYHTREPACSSMFPPLASIYENYPCLDIIRPVGSSTMACQRLDSVVDKLGFGTVDAIKLDTQGSELPILQGTTESLKTALFVDVEVEFNALYEGQPLFHQVDAFLREQGFALWRFDNLVHYSPVRNERARTPMMIAGDPDEAVWVQSPGGQLFWAQALYVKNDLLPVRREPLDGDLPYRAALLALVYGAWDLASAIASRSADPEVVLAVR